jgi:hypothetical protein
MQGALAYMIMRVGYLDGGLVPVMKFIFSGCELIRKKNYAR